MQVVYIKNVVILIIFLGICGLAIGQESPVSALLTKYLGTEAPTEDLFAQYLGTSVSVQVCNSTIVQGTLINNTKDSIVVRDLCTPKVGNVLIKKSCIVMVYQGSDCID